MKKARFRSQHRAKVWPPEVRDECVDRYRAGEDLVELARQMGPSANQIRGWYFQRMHEDRRSAKERWRPGRGWPEQRGQKGAPTRLLRMFAELNAPPPGGLGYSRWESMVVLAVEAGWDHLGRKALKERGDAWSKDRRVRWHMRRLASGEAHVSSETKKKAVLAGLEAYDEHSADWLERLDLDKAPPAIQFVAEARAKRLDTKYGESAENRERDARAVLMHRLARRIEEAEGSRGQISAEDTSRPRPALSVAEIVDAEVVSVDDEG